MPNPTTLDPTGVNIATTALPDTAPGGQHHIPVAPAMKPPAKEDGWHVIELSLRSVCALFNSMDPAPFREKDLDAATS